MIVRSFSHYLALCCIRNHFIAIIIIIITIIIITDSLDPLASLYQMCVCVYISLLTLCMYVHVLSKIIT